MNPNDVAPMVMAVVLFLVVGGVLILRPIAKRLGSYLDVLAEERRRSLTGSSTAGSIDAQRILATLEALDHRIERLEERQEFTDALLSEGNRRTLPGGER